MQLGISLDELRTQLPEIRPVQLAIDGSDPLPTLRSLAEDPGFSGLLILSITSEWLITGTGRANEYVDHYVNRGNNINQRLNQAIGSILQDRLVVRSATVSLKRVLTDLVQSHAIPDPYYAPMRSDRSRPADYSLLDVETYRAERIRQTRERYEEWEHSPPTQAEFRDGVTVLADLIDAIRERGGNVALVHFPIEGELLEMSERHFPKTLFWDTMAASVSGPAVHFLDESALREFELPDASHIDARDSAAFTRELVQILGRIGFF